MASETFTVAWLKLDGVPEGAEALPWLLAVSRKTLANRRRALEREMKRDERLSHQASGFARDHAGAIVDLSALADAFGRLSETDREVLALIAWDGLEHGQAAAVFGCSTATFSVRLHRARGRLQAQLTSGAAVPIAKEEPA